MSRKPKVIVIVGPTASGKTRLSIQLAKKFNGEIVSADSRQVYKGMDIGTAKPTKKEMGAVKHYLINIKNPNQDYAAAEYKKDALRAIEKILKKNKTPIIVGGTGLYVKSVVDNLTIPAVKPDRKLRAKLEKEIKKYGLEYLFERLIRLDPEAAYIVDPKNPRRVIRALEIAVKTKKPLSSQRKFGESLFDFLEIGILMPKEKLRKRINQRVDQMMQDGLLKEVKKLVKKYGSDLKSLDAIGYREIIDYLNKKISLEEASDLIKKNTRRYAKRQMTWFKKDKRIHWISKPKDAFKSVKDFVLVP